MTIPCLELCEAYLLAQLLHHVRQGFDLLLAQIYAWTDNTIVHSWLIGNPRRFNTYVANQISYIVELIGPNRWNHVDGTDNLVDCASRGLFPIELLEHQLWWNGPNWLTQPPTAWPHQSDLPHIETTEERECTLHRVTQNKMPIISINHYSSYTKLKCVTAWILCFVNNCHTNKNGSSLQSSSSLITQELHSAEVYWISIAQEDCYWISIAQEDCFPEEIKGIKESKVLHSSSPLLSLHPILDSSGILCAGGRNCIKKVSYSSQHPVILSEKHPVTKLLIRF